MKFKIKGEKNEDVHELYLKQDGDVVYLRCDTCKRVIAMIDNDGILIAGDTCVNAGEGHQFKGKMVKE